MYHKKKNVTFCKNCAPGTGGFFPKLVWNLIFCPFFEQKSTQKGHQPIRKKTLHFVKIIVLVQGGFAGIWSEISVFAQFFGKKSTKKWRRTIRQRRYNLLKRSSWYREFFLYFILKSIFFPIFPQNQLNRTTYHNKKTIDFVKIVVLVKVFFPGNWFDFFVFTHFLYKNQKRMS